ncbi:ABC-2 family transporter protein [Umezawaea sp. Da 62-37]|uniref:ABC transporter permease n=1 Tax=Umezawaea sp. Da 62-37 TaxID=3075927 RepID=UPI0028F6EF17|nr:ABC-2 family transporter protein [Umezawaea sp. Da 62-37]WNV83509.1 ABC-2 family transporter protein [Umezawaea sp. Da 62-37]
MARVVRLYFRFLGVHLRALLEYQSDFWIMAVATVLIQVVNLVFLSAVFARIPTLRGWSFWAVVAMFALMAIAEGVGSFFFEGTWRLAEAINQGSLDYALVRPYPVVLQVTSSEIGVNGLTNIVTGGTMLAAALAHLDVGWSAGLVLLALVLFASAVVIKVAVNLASNSISFWLAGPSPLFAMAVHQVGELARYPLTIFPTALKATLGLVVPFAFITTFPLGFLLGTGTSPWLGLLTPLVAAYCVAVALVTFSRGLRRYESAGN